MTAILDARGLKCPLPVLRARKAMKEVAVGGLLKVLATDPGAPKDFVHFCETTGHELVESSESEGVYTLIIRKTVG
jgi:tRNA 2-thiouridine synthesizing protein A